MGLNDEFFTVDGDQGESEQPKVNVDVFKPTNPGDTPELKEDVDFIAVTQENDPTSDQDDMNLNQALEEACVRLRDLELFADRIQAEGGISMQAAMESVTIIPGLITEDHPKGFYTQSPSKTALKHAMEEMDQEKKSAFGRVAELVRAFIDKAVQWLRQFFSKFNFKKKKEELLAKEAEVKKQREEAEAKLAAQAEEIAQLKRAAAASNEEFEKQIQQHKQAAKQGEEAAAAKILDVQSQMRVLDETKNREIAAMLDEMDKLRRREESSRSARIEMQEKVKELSVLVYRSMCREAFDMIQHQEKEILKEYSDFWSDLISKDQVVSKYLFGNGFQNRLQTLKRMTTVLMTVRPMTQHIQELNEAFKHAQQDPAKLKQLITDFNFSHFSLPEQVFQKTSGFEQEAKAIPAKKYSEAFGEIKNELRTVFEAVANIKFEEILTQLEALSKTLQVGISINANSQNLSEIAEGYRALQGHVAKLMPYISKGAMTQRDLLVFWMRLDNLNPSATKYGGSQPCQQRVTAICNAVSRSVSLMESFTQSNLKQIVTETIVTQVYQLNR